MSDKPSKPPVVLVTTRTPEGTIRKGTRIPYRKPTAEVVEQRVEALAAYIRANPLANRFELHRKFCKKFGVAWDSIDKMYTPRARKLITKQASVSKEEAREVGLGVVTRLLNDPDKKIRLMAEKAYREIVGYAAPAQHRIGGPDGQPLPAPTSSATTVVFNIPHNQRNGD